MCDDGAELRPRGMLELVLEVADLDRAVAFYRDYLGMKEVERWGEPRPGVWLAMGIHQALGLWPATSGGPGVGLYDSRGGVHVHFALHVKLGTLDSWIAQLRAAGVEVRGPVDFQPGNRSIYVVDPDGNVVELAEWAHDWQGVSVSGATEMS
jgi:catechol 2,3-dioxygenase-like lactoylglutathione lyase family enzyme